MSLDPLAPPQPNAITNNIAEARNFSFIKIILHEQILARSVNEYIEVTGIFQRLAHSFRTQKKSTQADPK